MGVPSSHTGAIVAGRFEIESALGEGASGTVWHARDRELGIHVAVKILRSHLRLEPKRLAAFAREAEVCVRMLSPNIVRVLAFSADVRALPYIAYELLPGETLAARLARLPRLTIDEVENIIVQIARGLARAHMLGVIHRDMKPANVFLTEDDRGGALAKILDFGIASLRGNRATEGEDLYGTLEYMAPELVFQTSEPDARSDLYGLAALTYECLTGSTHVQVASVPELVACMAVGIVPPSVAPRVGRAAAVVLDDFFERGLAKNPTERFQSARELAEDLHRVVKAAKSANPALALGRPSREMRAVVGSMAPVPPSSTELPRRTKSQALPAMRPRAASFVFAMEDEIDLTANLPPSSKSRDPRRE